MTLLKNKAKAKQTSLDSASLKSLENRLGYHFVNKDYLGKAVTHNSLLGFGEVASYQGLEFLGDRVLSLVIAEALFQRFPKADEGFLAQCHSNLVSRSVCVTVAKHLDLNSVVRVAPGISKGGGCVQDSILGDVCEALLAAIFMDGGFTPARKVILELWKNPLESAENITASSKTQLQELAQKLEGSPLPKYAVMEKVGPDHKPYYKVKASIDSLGSAHGEGSSKREAEKAAAEKLLQTIATAKTSNKDLRHG